MRFFPAGKMIFCRGVAVAALTVLAGVVSGRAQHPTSTNPDQTKPSEEGTQVAVPVTPSKPKGKVLYQRSLDGSSNAVGTTGTEAQTKAKASEAPAVSDAERTATKITSLDLDVRIVSEGQQIAVRGLVTVQNVGSAPLRQIPLQLSSSLKWERVRSASQELQFSSRTLESDVDDTLRLHEAVVQLPEPLAVGASRQLDVLYSGRIDTRAERLVSLGVPDDSVAHSDWDQIGAEFTALRGFGNVVWYPVASIPVIVNDGARLSEEIGQQKLRAVGSSFRLKLTVEFPSEHAPALAAVNGHRLKLSISDPGVTGTDVPGIATADTGETKLGFAAPSLIVASGAARPGTHMTVYADHQDEVAIQSWLAASKTVSPMIERWLGLESRDELTVVDLPDADDLPWESGALLAIPVRDGPADQIQSVLAHSLTHAWMAPTPYWLNEGAANFMGAMWDDNEHRRERALATLERGRGALALAEPPSPGEGQGQPLLKATSPVYYSTKAAWVLWMVRDAVGDDALRAALQASNNMKDTASSEHGFQEALKAAAPRRDLKWLFSDWIDADRGLPDLSVDKVYPNAVQSGNWLVSVTISNVGYAAAEVPVTVRSATNTTTERVLVPARGTVTPRILVQGKPTEAQVNDGSVPETEATVHITHLNDTADGKGASSAVQ